MIWILIATCITTVMFGVRLFRIKQQLRKITTQLHDRTSGSTEKKVTVSLIDNDLNKLAAAINRNLKLQKSLRIEVRRNDLQLKDSIANLSHDLRTPLTSILGYLQLSRNPECPVEKREDYLKTVDDKAHALKAMINSLYELSVLDVNETLLNEEKFDLNILVTDVLVGQYELFQKHGISLQVNLPDYPIWISGDHVACTRIVQNLLNNTILYANEKADIVLTKEDAYAILSIRNPAPNLSQDDIDHLFDRFYTADKSRKSSGTGLGLYIVKTLLTKMKGKIVGISLNNQILCIEVGFILAASFDCLDIAK
ncbi:sensor histidine kinase [Acetobacterium paludosum]|uniref:histidine kinase n=1 Tax=Acetobacterium paludosum TaxID=52693 RepID=A0A923HQY7_9FIRM|nr:HAMP domain-containing sensor histidine kinase [Acetobacterium paludosum]MBC3886771.1 sensor histidine kinase [Acetobacterium paludosum]